MPKIFISYRRDDSGHAADRIYDKLAQKFDVFFDVNGIPLGVDWKKYLTTNVQECALMLVIIGRDWLDMIEQRAGRQDDFVRFEIENALNRGIPIIPLFLDGLTDIPEERLPASIAELASRQGMPIRRASDFDHDMGRLIAGIERLLGAKSLSPTLVGTERALSYLLPAPFAWVLIPEGEVTLLNNDGMSRIEEGKRFNVPAFSIAKYPVTNAQFRKFIDGDGYINQRWWTTNGWQERVKGNWIEPLYWQDTMWNGMNHPVVGISWFEALAFCNWLRETTGENLALPTEQQWQRAAQGDDGRAYPWGDDWDCNRCNNPISPCDSNQTTPVTQYEGRNKGDSPFGVVDMTGNVWEYCLNTLYSGEIDENITGVRAQRGGSWDGSWGLSWLDADLNPDSFRVSLREGSNPPVRSNNVGFRIARIY